MALSESQSGRSP